MEEYRAYESEAEYYLDMIELVDVALTDAPNIQDKKELYFQKLEQINGRNKLSIEEGMVMPLEYFFHVFLLNEFEKHCVRLALAPELGRKYEALYQSLQEDALFCYPTIDFCIQSFAHDLAEVINLIENFRDREVYFKNIFCLEQKTEILKGSLSIQLKLKDEILDFIFGGERRSWKFGEEVKLVYPEYVEIDSTIIHENIVQDITKTLKEEQNKVLCYICGPSGIGKKTIVSLCMKELGYPLLFVDLSKIWKKGTEFLKLMNRIVVESILRQADICFSHAEVLLGDENSSMLETIIPIVFNTSKEVFVLSETDWSLRDSNHENRFIKYNLGFTDYSARVSLWETILQKIGMEVTFDVSMLAEHFNFTPKQIKAAIEDAEQMAVDNDGSSITKDLLWKCCQNQIKYSFGDNVTYVQSLYSFKQLILPPKQMQILKRICSRIKHKRQVYSEWGFDEKVLYGKGVSMLFCGPPGTGKTMSAGVIANELHMDLYKVDLSMITSKYIGETEKNLKKIFEEGKKGPIILFFDEADALFGKRTEVKDAHDKYANFETSYLLQMMEEYEGVIILATNFVKNFDEAFKRRIKFIVDFPYPSEDERLNMWKSIFPQTCPVKDDIDFAFLAEHYQLSGSSIKEVALTAAFLAAQEENEVDMAYILRAVEEEMKKRGEILGKEDFGEYFSLLNESAL